MSLIKLLTNFSGRTGRLGFWFGFFVLTLSAALLAIPAAPNILSDDPFKSIVKSWREMGGAGLGMSLLLFYPAIAIVIKRLHDRNKGGWRAALFWAPACLQTIASFTGWSPLLEKIYLFTNWISGYLIAVGIWFIIELGFFSGTNGPNDYGPKPGAE